MRYFVTLILAQRMAVFTLGQALDGMAPCKLDDCDQVTQFVLLAYRLIAGN